MRSSFPVSCFLERLVPRPLSSSPLSVPVVPRFAFRRSSPGFLFRGLHLVADGLCLASLAGTPDSRSAVRAAGVVRCRLRLRRLAASYVPAACSLESGVCRPFETHLPLFALPALRSVLCAPPVAVSAAVLSSRRPSSSCCLLRPAPSPSPSQAPGGPKYSLAPTPTHHTAGTAESGDRRRPCGLWFATSAV
jgi:hypothetical protein